MRVPSWWTEERVAELKTRWANNETGSEIWRAMGAASRNAVVGKAFRLGLGLHGVVHHHSPRPRARRNGKNEKSKTVHYVDGRVFIVQGEEMIEEPQAFANPLKLMDLRDHHCRWPGAGRGIDMLYCAAPVANGHSYCPAHCRIAYAPNIPRPPKAPRL
jgi:GcrA cell cycle regulator